MQIQINITDRDVSNFSAGAKGTLHEQVQKYTNSVIKEANLIEEGLREDGANTEITSNIILQAVRKNKTTHYKKSNTRLIFIKILSALSLLVTGFLFDPSGYQDNTVKLIIFIIFLIISCVSTVLQIVFEERM